MAAPALTRARLHFCVRDAQLQPALHRPGFLGHTSHAVLLLPDVTRPPGHSARLGPRPASR